MLLSHRVKRCLARGPCTSADVAAILEITPRAARIGIWVLKTKGTVVATKWAVPNPGGRPYKIYKLKGAS
jgi:predicted ArsR family transcriptional regulator